MKRWNYGSEERKISKFVAVTMAIFVVLYAVVFSTSLYVQKTAEQQCYDTLRKSTENLGKEIKIIYTAIKNSLKL